uniref:GRAM domain-containing protein n=1 Tax=Gopherus agassizii TaxID=38772 RepID=A0A452J1X9_9SAUR
MRALPEPQREPRRPGAHPHPLCSGRSVQRGRGGSRRASVSFLFLRGEAGLPAGRAGTRAMFDTGSPSPRSSPSSSPSLRKRLLLPPRTSPELPADAMVEKSTESAPDRGPLSAPVNYPLSARSFIRNNKKAQSWYSMLSPTYKQRNEDFRRIFKGLPESERLLVDYSCALQRDILLQGRLYLSENWLCFYSNIFRWETAISVPLREVKCLKKEKMARLIPNAIQVCTAADKVR